MSASLMIVLIAQLVGISDIAALVALFGVNTAMILFGWLQERYEEPAGTGWLPFTFGCIVGIVPWLAISIYLLSPGSNSSATPPGFVYGIFISLFVFFNIFALNQWLQYRARAVGPITCSASGSTSCSASPRSRLWPGRSSPAPSPLTEEQAYDVLAENPEFELQALSRAPRRRDRGRRALELAGNLAFPRLARYIGGHNRSSRKGRDDRTSRAAASSRQPSLRRWVS